MGAVADWWRGLGVAGAVDLEVEFSILNFFIFLLRWNGFGLQMGPFKYEVRE